MTSHSAAANHFADSLVERVRQLGHPLCVGLDPHLAEIPPLFRSEGMHPADRATAAAVEAFLTAVVGRIGDRVAAVKPQIAFFEQLGWRGIQVLENVVRLSRRLGLKVVLDAKRGDIGSTAEAYARAYLEPGGGCEVDAITLNPYLGGETLEPFFERCLKFGKGAFVLVKTSNPGAKQLQDQCLLPSGRPVFESVAEMLTTAAERLKGPSTGLSSLGVVVGASYPQHAERVRQLLPTALFLVPGYGAQGGSAREARGGTRQRVAERALSS